MRRHTKDVVRHNNTKSFQVAVAVRRLRPSPPSVAVVAVVSPCPIYVAHVYPYVRTCLCHIPAEGFSTGGGCCCNINNRERTPTPQPFTRSPTRPPRVYGSIYYLKLYVFIHSRRMDTYQIHIIQLFCVIYFF